MKKTNKKGQLDIFGSLSIGIAVLAITLVIAFMILNEGKETVKRNIDGVSVIDETVTWLNNTYVTLTHSPSSYELSCSAVYNNATGTGHLIGAGNYTCSPSGINLLNNSVGWTPTINVSYAYKLPDAAYNATSTMQNATSDIPGWIPIVLITAIGGVLILMVRRFGR